MVYLALHIPAVHPHVRGDCFPLVVYLRRACGSPPRAWGLRKPFLLAGAAWRFTPTCVGTASCRPPAVGSSPVHPHVRGDCGRRTARRSRPFGSPPRAWGLLCGAEDFLARPRFTPTCVGTARQAQGTYGRHAVHPHVRGDCRVVWLVPMAIYGSPPRAWGLLRCPAVIPEFPRFTPTCVGTAPHANGWNRRGSVHPHVRGDCIKRIAVHTAADGSPPRAWGLRSRQRLRRPRYRFTPTCVGTAWLACKPIARLPVHPHVRGDCVNFLTE